MVSLADYFRNWMFNCSEIETTFSYLFLMKRTISRWLLATIFLTSGFLHFYRPTIFLELMPEYFPIPEGLVLISGLFELITGLFLLGKRFRVQGSNLAILLLLSFFPIHFQHLLDGGLQSNHFHFGLNGALVRFGFQFFLIYWAWWVRK